MSNLDNALHNLYSSNDYASVDFLNQLLEKTSSLYIGLGSANKALSSLTNTEYQQKLSMLGEKKQTYQCVLVGQIVSLQKIEWVIRDYFQNCLIELSAHPLHMCFGNSAVLITLSHNQSHSPISTAKSIELSKRHQLECFKLSSVKLKEPGLLVMDMDSTIIDMECIDEIAELAGAAEQVKAMTERAMQGELDFTQSLQARVNCLKGVDVTLLDSIKHRLPVNPGFAKTIGILQSYGWTTVIASGGFTFFADYLKQSFDLSAAHSNVLSIADGKLTGSVEGAIVDATEKRNLLEHYRDKMKIKNSQTVAIGDGANDLLMMSAASLGIAFKAKASVKSQADANILYSGFEGILYCLIN